MTRMTVRFDFRIVRGNQALEALPSGMRTCCALAVVATLSACLTPHVMSPYGDECGVNHMPAHDCYARDRTHDGVDFGPASAGDVVIASADAVVSDVFHDRSRALAIVARRDARAAGQDRRLLRARRALFEYRAGAHVIRCRC